MTFEAVGAGTVAYCGQEIAQANRIEPRANIRVNKNGT